MDECQDFSPYQLALLRELYPAATFTLVGDLMQGIHADEGIRDYGEWLGPVFRGMADMRHLVTSYRSTVEIMTLAGRVASRHPVPEQQLAMPVLRHGEAPRLSSFPSDRERYAALRAQVHAWQEEGFRSIALIEKTSAGAEKLYRLLRDSLPVRLLHEDDTDYQGGMMILPASMVKGLEFDCVAVCNASAEHFPDDPFLCRVLYVLLTRPLHRLHLFATGAITPLVQAV